MFTGIIEELGKVVAIEEQPDAVRLTISGPLVTSDIKRGDSISCSGTCLTAIEIENGSFTADVMKETLRLTSLDGVKVGDPINLERAMTMQTRFGGHHVQGHVDGVGHFISREKSENWDWVRIQVPKELMRYVVMKGSITLDGISLTVNELGEDFVGLSLIPETLKLTTLGYKSKGDKVNVEVDVMAKHIERLIETSTRCTKSWQAYFCCRR
ncbi:MAG: riboflavin synthase [Actinobacteria bacterium]|nr:riboflavin synthase [Actinomycetota bacterium]